MSYQGWRGVVDHVAFCGTPAGVRRHRRDGEPACDECKAADARRARQQRTGGDGVGDGRTRDQRLPQMAPDPDWAEQGLCRTHPEPDLWFLDVGRSSAPAKAICAACPVRDECLEHALRVNEKHGIWGGTTEKERRRLRRLRLRVVA